MMEHKPTKEQDRIFLFTKKRPENILIKAYAGAGKTSTIVEAVKMLPTDKSITFLAFNRHIKEELTTKLPEHVRCYTTYGIGVGAIKRKYGDSIQFDEFKMDKLIQKKAKYWKLDEEFDSEEDINVYLNNVKKLVNLCRLSLTLNPKYVPYVAERYDIGLSRPKDIKRVLKVLDTATIDRKTYDYTDMIFLPAIDNSIWFFPQDYVFVDECLPYKQKISTVDGKINIGYLCKMFNDGIKLPLVITYNEKQKIFENKKIENIWCNGEKEVHCVKLGSKRSIKSTVNHKFLTDIGWKRLDELKIGDAILSNYVGQPYSAIPTKTQRSIIIGTSIGDGSIQKLKSPNIFRLRCVHGEKQKEYLEWKAKILNSEIYVVNNNGYSSKDIYKFNSRSFYFRENLKKHSEVIDSLTPESLAILWMDDGHKYKLENGGKFFAVAPHEDSVKHLQNKLLVDFGIETKLRCYQSSSTGNDYYCLSLIKCEMEKLSKIIAPYIHPTMKYKILLKHSHLVDLSNWDYSKNPYGCMVVSSEHEFLENDKVYDMSVEENHNFIIPSSSNGKGKGAKDFGLIAHNCQDLNRCQIKIIEKVLKRDRKTKKLKGRLIAVGDFYQGIYGFNAADEKSFQWFEKFPKTKVLPLSVSFRCSKAVIRKAQEIVPNIQALPNAPEGDVREGNVLEEAKSGDFILCRTTMPLVKLFFQFLMEKKKAVIKGSDIGLHLVELIGKINNLEKLIKFWEGELFAFRRDLKNEGILNPIEHSGYAALEDKVNTLLFLANISDSIVDLKFKIKTIFTDKIQGIVLSTVHKIKGLEADKVFIIRPDLLPMQTPKAWQAAQEKNLEYVAYTRAKLELIFDNNWTDE